MPVWIVFEVWVEECELSILVHAVCTAAIILLEMPKDAP
jgi:hypothetical protein